MSDLIFEIAKLAVMVMAVVVGRYVIPYVKEKLESENMKTVVSWVEYAVFMAQQVYGKETGADRKEFVVDFVKGILEEKGIRITEEQLDVLIEAAVKQLRIAEKAG